MLPVSSRTQKRADRLKYNDRHWLRMRRDFLATYPFCIVCLVQGEYTVATVADHIERHADDRDLFFDFENLQPLCKRCHDVEKQSHERRGGTGETWLRLLREIMMEKHTENFVGSMEEWLPIGIADALI